MKTKTKRKKPIGTIKDELAACRRAFRKYPYAKWAWCIHHSELNERIDRDGIEDRIQFILWNKREKARRLRNLRPVKPTRLMRDEWQADLFNRQWPDNTWNGYSIF